MLSRDRLSSMPIFSSCSWRPIPSIFQGPRSDNAVGYPALAPSKGAEIRVINLLDDESKAVEVVLLYLYTTELPKFKTGNGILQKAAHEAPLAADKYGLVTLRDNAIAISRLV
jgi:hypothetical protein